MPHFMKNYQTVSDSDLLFQIRNDAENERKSGLAVIHQLREVARRRLDAKLGYPSLHRYCMEELKFSSGSAWRRIKAMQALAEMPELEEKIEKGALTLASVSQVQNFCQQNEKTPQQKAEIFAQVEGLSKRDAERALAEIAPQPERPEKLRALNAESTELRVTLTRETLDELEKIRDLIAHAHPGASYAEVISYLAKLGIKKLDPATPKRVYPPGENTHSIPAATRRAVWRRDGGACKYVAPETGRVCGARALLQPDHLIPRAKGGIHDESNLQLKCRRHNLLAAVEEFGQAKMGPYLRDT
jgi:hypothetical protein